MSQKTLSTYIDALVLDIQKERINDKSVQQRADFLRLYLRNQIASLKEQVKHLEIDGAVKTYLNGKDNLSTLIHSMHVNPSIIQDKLSAVVSYERIYAHLFNEAYVFREEDLEVPQGHCL